MCFEVAIKPSLPAEFMGVVSNPHKCEYGSREIFTVDMLNDTELLG